MPFINIPYLSCIICFFMGLVAGRWLAGVLDYRVGHRIGKVVVFGILIGMSLTPIGLLLPISVTDLFQTVFSQPQSLISALTGLVSMLFSPVCFFIGVLRATVWGER